MRGRVTLSKFEISSVIYKSQAAINTGQGDLMNQNTLNLSEMFTDVAYIAVTLVVLHVLISCYTR